MQPKAATPADPDQAMDILAHKMQVPPARINGWTLATRYSTVQYKILDRGLKDFALKVAARAVLRRAAALVGPIRPASMKVFEPLAEPWSGELEIEPTIENLAGKEFADRGDWIMSRRSERRRQLTLMLDASLSMAGGNLALSAVAAAVLALKMKPEDLAVVVFDTRAATLSRIDEPGDPESLIRAILRRPARGFTNIQAGLRAGRRELMRGSNPNRAGLIITDGVYTEGDNPLEAAAAFPRLFVLLTEAAKMDRDLCERMAAAGGGDMFSVGSYDDLPRRMLQIANRLLR